MKKLNLKLYETPVIEVVEVRVEHGFATSAGGEGGDWSNSDWNLGHNDWLN